MLDEDIADGEDIAEGPLPSTETRYQRVSGGQTIRELVTMTLLSAFEDTGHVAPCQSLVHGSDAKIRLERDRHPPC